MIKTNGIATKEQPYLTEAINQDQKKVIVNSSRKASEYMSPSEMLEVAFASCLTMTTKGVLFTHHIAYRDVHVTCSMTKNEEGSNFNVEVEIDADIPDEVKKEMIQESYQKCYVRNILIHPISTTLEA